MFNWEFPNNFYKAISKNNMTRINEMTWHKTSQNALMKLHIYIPQNIST